MVIYPQPVSRSRLEAFVRRAATAHLFVNDVTPTDVTEAGALVEPRTRFYAPAVLVGAAWTLAPVGTELHATYPELMFLIDAGEPVFGTFVLDAAGDLLWSERFDRPVTADQLFVGMTQVGAYA